MELPECPHALTLEEIKRILGTGPQGLNEEEVAQRRELFGKNLIEEEEIDKLELFLRQFRNFLIYILMVAALISLLAGDLKDFGVIIALIIANGVIGFWQELKAETSIRALKQLTETRVRVIREGKNIEIPSRELVPGDLVLLGEGDLVPADIRLTECKGLQVDEALLTGESMPVEKDHRAIVPPNAPIYAHANSLFSGTAIVRGCAMGIVVKTGRFTYLASIAERAKEASPATPFERAIRAFSMRYAMIITMVLFVVGISALLQGKEWMRIAYLLVAQLVSAVPEGLPIVVTLVMVVGALTLSKKKTLTRHLPSVETLGSATVIASDKTGTITEGRLKVERVHAIEEDVLERCAALCNDAESGRGDPIDVALSNWVDDYEGIRRAFPRVWSFPFDTRMKLMATAHDIGGEWRFFVKGAFEALVRYAEPGEELGSLAQTHDLMAGEGLRVLAFGTGRWNGSEPEKWKIRIVGLIGFLDPPKEGVREAVRTAKCAGIRVIMITGDHPMTAKKVAASVEIFRDGDRVLTGAEIERMEDHELYAALGSSTVLARILPEHKYRVVKVFQANQEIVAVTGDGVNDVPALKVADLGIAMGSGAEAAKGVAKMVILDSNLNVIVDAIKNGRVIVDNVRKVIYYLLSTSICEVVLISTAILGGLPLPLFPIQVLWINLVTDGVQDKMFPFIKEEGDVMRRPPKRPERQFFDSRQISRILIFGLIVGFASFLMYRYLLDLVPYDHAVSIIFTAVVALQWMNGIQAQKEREPFFCNLWKSLTINPLIFVSIIIGLAMQLTALYLVPEWFRATPLELGEWSYVILLMIVTFLVVETMKWAEYLSARGTQ